jgi:hypothetical protein
METIGYILAAAYFIAGIVVQIAVVVKGVPKSMLFAVRLLSDMAMASGFTHLLFIVLWPIWLLIGFVLLKKERERAREASSVRSGGAAQSEQRWDCIGSPQSYEQPTSSAAFSKLKDQYYYSELLYFHRQGVEGFFARIKRRRRLATRYEKLSETFLGVVTFAAVLDWMHFEVWKHDLMELRGRSFVPTTRFWSRTPFEPVWRLLPREMITSLNSACGVRRFLVNNQLPFALAHWTGRIEAGKPEWWVTPTALIPWNRGT